MPWRVECLSMNKFVALFLLLVIAIHPLAARDSSAALLVKVVDAGGATWPKAVVALVNTQTFELKKVTTGIDGLARFDVPHGRYVVMAASSDVDCMKAALQQVWIGSGQPVSITLVLQLDESIPACAKPIT